MSSWIDRAIAIRTVDENDVPTDGAFRLWKFEGATLTPDGDRLVISITGGGGGESTPIPTARMLGNISGSTAVASALTATQVRTFLNVADGATSNAGTVTSVSGSEGISVANGTTTPAISIADGALAIAKLASIATARFLGRATAGSGAVEALTGTQATSLLDVASTSLKGLLSAADKLLLDGATAAATALALVRRDSSGDAALRRLTVTDRITAVGSSLSVLAGLIDLGSWRLGDVGADSYQTASTGDAFYRATVHARLIAISGHVYLTSDLGSIFGRGKSLSLADVDAVERYSLVWRARQTTTSTADAVPAGFTLTPGAEGGSYLVTLRASIGANRATWVWEVEATGTTATFDAGAAPVPRFSSTPGVAGFDAHLEESGGTTIDVHVQPDTASAVVWSLTMQRIR